MARKRRTSGDPSGAADRLARPDELGAAFDRHYDHVWRYICRRAGVSVADELASEVFARALAGRSRLTDESVSARAWLYGIATNLLREHSRKELRRLRAYARAVQPIGTAGGLDGVEGRVDAAARAPAVAKAIAGLRPADRDALLLFALTELDYEGIAVAMGVPVGTVRSRLHRARRRLQRELGAEESLSVLEAVVDRSVR
jgi:RNA polymerase sigma-70 factor (ECF subfamily)